MFLTGSPRPWLATLLALIVATPGLADERRVPQARLPLFKTAPVIDGSVSAEEWAGAVRMERFCHGPALVPMEASFWAGSDGKKLFIAVVSETPPGGKILARVAPLPDGRDARTWLDDSIELVLAPEPAAPPGQCRLYHAVINAQGALHDTLYVVGGTVANPRLTKAVLPDVKPDRRNAWQTNEGSLEQYAYWLDGLVRLGYILHDDYLIRKATDRLNLVVDGVHRGGNSFLYWQKKPPKDFLAWAHSHMGRALVAWHEASGDRRILDALVSRDNACLSVDDMEI